MAMNEPKNFERLGGHVGDVGGALAGAEVQRLAADLHQLGVAGDGEEVVLLAGHQVRHLGPGERADLAQLGEVVHAVLQRAAPELGVADGEAVGRHGGLP
ncbi:hypothetical protein [Aquihabitans sp. G128]|uniref:hypothetical protein n=1 Tax=Aquihabitans sp. G128 TaxID=2849779 RepID=UPI0020B42105|nr:hypothetical protein [Aquihabitans sp. G128]